MDFFDKIKNVQEYIKMVENSDPIIIIPILRTHLNKGSAILELGMGPGKDLNILKKDYKITGSDKSQVFIDLYKKDNPNADVLQLDAVTLDINKTFDCIYSNKVLMHLKKDELKESIKNQNKILNKDGIVFHTFWKGTKTEEMDGLFFQYYEEDELEILFKKEFQEVTTKLYKEFEDNDSILIIGKKR